MTADEFMEFLDGEDKRVDVGLEFVYADDWMAVYVNGNIVYQGHSIDEYHLLDILGIKCNHTDAYNQADETGSFPEKFEDVIDDVKWEEGVGRSFT